jgi:hypothetical protein
MKLSLSRKKLIQRKLDGLLPAVQLLQIFRHELRHFFELGHIGGIDLHERAVGFEAVARDFLFAGGGVIVGWLEEESGRNFFVFYAEHAEDAEVFDEIEDAFVGVEEFDIWGGGFGVIVAENESGEDAEEGAVHRHAFAEIEDEFGEAALAQFADEILQIEACGVIRAAWGLNEGRLIDHGNAQR